MTMNVGKEVTVTKQPCFVGQKHSKTAYKMYFNPSSTSLCPQHIKKMLRASEGLRTVPWAKKSDFLPSDLTRTTLLPSFYIYDRVPQEKFPASANFFLAPEP
jgi:hypothetical protein